MSDTSIEGKATTILRALVGSPDATFRDGQLEAIEALVSDRRRVLVVQRTGWGKSAVYFVATRLLREQGAGPTLLVSPLLALMRNQIDAGTRGGVRTETINSDNKDDWDRVKLELDRDAIDLLIISPERFANQSFRDNVLSTLATRVGLLVVDEVHCISDWGHDFRPDYRRIGKVLDLLPRGVPVLGTTATANDRVVADVETQLGNDLLTLRGPLARPSLALDTRSMPSQAERFAWLSTVIPTLPGTGIVYCLTVADTSRVASWLRAQGINAAAYTGSTDSDLRKELEDRLLSNNIKVLVATSALGMGYDKPDLAFVIHYQSPGSPVAYYQQVGRAGRALDHAHGILLSGTEDTDIQDYFIRVAFPSREHADAVVELLAERADWVRISEIEQVVNIRRGRLTAMLKIFEVEGAVEKNGLSFRRTLAPWSYPEERIEQITEQRRAEQEIMARYLASEDCLMELLGNALDDPAAARCGRCSRCTGTRIEVELERSLIISAQEHLRSEPLIIEPRENRPTGGRFPADLQLEPGRALSRWADGGWGTVVKEQKLAGRFADELVSALEKLVRSWHPTPEPVWITFVPSLRDPKLVASLAERLGERLALPVHPVVRKVRSTEPQKEMENSSQQHGNIVGAFEVVGPVPDGPVLLIDDIFDSRWTLTVIGGALREAGSGPVFPLVLAEATGS
ncbi:MAG: RecQ family ATP-dependent DNA helicase [Acidimicrobiia bacterium]|nr:RecQ family ATP-dependent DNA helicase [Acidimicrobiia bacterium]